MTLPAVVRGADASERLRPDVVWVDRRSVILEECMVWNVIESCGRAVGRARRARPVATGCPVRVDDSEIEATHERAPSYVLVIQAIQEISDIGASEPDRRTRPGADVAGRIG